MATLAIPALRQSVSLSVGLSVGRSVPHCDIYWPLREFLVLLSSLLSCSSSSSPPSPSATRTGWTAGEWPGSWRSSPTLSPPPSWSGSGPRSALLFRARRASSPVSRGGGGGRLEEVEGVCLERWGPRGRLRTTWRPSTPSSRSTWPSTGQYGVRSDTSSPPS